MPSRPALPFTSPLATVWILKIPFTSKTFCIQVIRFSWKTHREVVVSAVFLDLFVLFICIPPSPPKRALSDSM